MTLIIAYVILGQFNLMFFNMIREILTIVNIVDVVVFFIFIRSAYIGFTQGLIVELFKMMGILFATFFTLHYFIILTSYLGGVLPLPMDMIVVVAYIMIWVIMVALFAVVRQGWMLGFPPIEKTFIYKILGGVLGTIRAMFVSGLLFLVIFISSSAILVQSARSSFAGFYLKSISVDFYKSCYMNFIVRVFPKEPMNDKIFEFFPEELKR